MKYKGLWKNTKAISPVLATLLMIAIAVAASLVTYAWTMTYLGTTTTRAGHAIQIQSVNWSSGSVDVYVQNVGDGTIEITDAYIDGAQATVTGAPLQVLEGKTVKVTLSGGPFANGDQVHIKIVCKDGTFTEGTYTVEGV